MKKLIIFPALLAGLLLSGCDQTSETPSAEPSGPQTVASPAADQASGMEIGKHKYELFCSGCHNAGEGHAGTMKLSLLKGEENSVITERNDLNAEYIRFVVRDGLLEMAPFRPTDISDSELDSVIQYILSGDDSATGDSSSDTSSAKNNTSPSTQPASE